MASALSLVPLMTISRPKNLHRASVECAKCQKGTGVLRCWPFSLCGSHREPKTMKPLKPAPLQELTSLPLSMWLHGKGCEALLFFTYSVKQYILTPTTFWPLCEISGQQKIVSIIWKTNILVIILWYELQGNGVTECNKGSFWIWFEKQNKGKWETDEEWLPLGKEKLSLGA